MKLHIKKGDIVIAIAGADAAARRTGKVLQVFPDKGKAIVEGLHLVKKHFRKSQDHPKGEIAEKESPLAVSNLLLYCPHCKKGVRVSGGRDEKGKRVRKCRKCGHGVD